MKFNTLPVVLTTTVCFILIIIITTFNVSTFALSNEKNQMEQNIVKATNQTLISPSSNETGQAIPIQKNATDLGGNITEGAKNLVSKVGKGIKDLAR
ncbi:MAG TPA: hypothetical protein VFP49_02625 [Nitrososphaeraceae archaeon]|nr:hypothetical protein [Nitrososphaeraceae archaeon]